jgi:hypothetical protein
MNALFLLINDFPIVLFLVFVLAGGTGFYLLMIKFWKLSDEIATPPPELLLIISRPTRRPFGTLSEPKSSSRF